MNKMFRRFVTAAFLFLVTAPLAAQQVQNHAVPIGRGGGVVGFGAAVPGPAGIPFISSGLTLDPAFGPVQNIGITPGAANTVKGSLDGANTSDLALPSCTALGSALRWTSGVGASCGTVIATTGFDMPINLGLSASVASTSLTLTVTQANGSAPTAGSPVAVPLRSTTLTTGSVSVGTIASTISITVPSGATLGTSSSNVPFRIWIFLTANGGGTPALAVATCSNSTTVFPCTSWETTLKTTTTIGAGSTAGGTLYATSGVASDAVRIVGYCEYASGLATAGSWVSPCTTLQVMEPGIKKPGDVVQTVTGTTTTSGTTTSATYVVLTSGQTLAITPTSTTSLIRAELASSLTQSTSSSSFIKLSRGTVNNTGLFSSVSSGSSGATAINTSVNLLGFDFPQTTSSTTYAVQGLTSAGTTSVPISGNTAVMTLSEIQG